MGADHTDEFKKLDHMVFVLNGKDNPKSVVKLLECIDLKFGKRIDNLESWKDKATGAFYVIGLIVSGLSLFKVVDLLKG